MLCKLYTSGSSDEHTHNNQSSYDKTSHERVYWSHRRHPKKQKFSEPVKKQRFKNGSKVRLEPMKWSFQLRKSPKISE